jgi:hypothetical protein
MGVQDEKKSNSNTEYTPTRTSVTSNPRTEMPWFQQAAKVGFHGDVLAARQARNLRACTACQASGRHLSIRSIRPVENEPRAERPVENESLSLAPPLPSSDQVQYNCRLTVAAWRGILCVALSHHLHWTRAYGVQRIPHAIRLAQTVQPPHTREFR